MPMRWARRAACLASALAVSPLPALAAGSCASLHGLSIPDLTIGQAADVAAGSFTPATAPALKLDVPAFCRVAATATPTPDSQIGLEVWVPSGGAWNGKLLGIGNGGYSSVLDYPAMADGIRRGYATVATDDGHTGEDLRFVIGHPGKAADWADRAIHAMTVAAKPVLRAYAGRLPERSYFAGCSTGGFQGLAEAQRYPEDYDGIIAGAPGYPRFNLSASFMYAWAVNHDAAGKEILTRPKLPTLNKAVTAACAGPDGVIADPRQCHFDPASLLCTGAETDGCLTAAQVAVVRAVYRGPENARTHQSVFPGWDPGSEALGGDPKAGWTAYIVGQPEPVRLELWKYWAFGDPNFDYRSFDYDRDLDYADQRRPEHERRQYRPAPFPAARRQAADVLWLGGQRVLRADGHRLLRKPAAHGRRCHEDPGLQPAVPPARCRPLQRRPGPGQLRRHRRAGQLGGAGHRTGPPGGEPLQQRRCRPQPAAVPVSADRPVGRFRRPERGGELHLRHRPASAPAR